MITSTWNDKQNRCIWAAHELMEKNLIDKTSDCESLLKCNKIDPFLKRMIKYDAKRIVHNNVAR